jgi:hypothetical protein
MIRGNEKTLIFGMQAVVLLALLVPACAAAGEGPSSTGASYLLHPVGAKSIAMGEVKSALLGEPFGWLSNPGAMGDMEGFGLGVFHTEWILDTRYDNVTYHYRVNDMFVLCGGFLYTYRPSMEGYSATLEPRELKSNNYQAVVGAGVTPVSNLTAGVNLKYFREKLDEWSAGGVAVDLGFLYYLESTKTAAGLSVQNLGSAIQFEEMEEPLPVTFRLGLSQRVTPKEGIFSITAALDLVKPRFESLYTGAGCELEFYEAFAVRAGYAGQEYRAGSGFTMGGGFKVRKTVTIDYAWTDYGDLGNFHHISLFIGIPKRVDQTVSLLEQ